MEEKNPHILVVDDDRVLLKFILATLEDQGYRVTGVDNGPAALASLQEDAPDLVLLDYLMPGWNGYEILQKIRRESSVPIIMITGVLDHDASALTLDLGADDFIHKPFSTRILVARIQAKLRKTSPSA